MITPQTFAEGMALIAERWNREWGPNLQAVYYEQLTEALDDDQFIAGVKRCIRTAGLTPPSIQQIIDAGSPPPDETDEAAKAFRAILSAPDYLPTRGAFFSTHTIEQRFGVVAARAFVGSGGERRWNGMSDADIPFALKDFTAAYRAALAIQRTTGELLSLSAKPAPRLPSRQEAERRLTEGQARRALEEENRVRAHYGLEPKALPPASGGNGHGEPSALGSLIPPMPEAP